MSDVLFFAERNHANLPWGNLLLHFEAVVRQPDFDSAEAFLDSVLPFRTRDDLGAARSILASIPNAPEPVLAELREKGHPGDDLDPALPFLFEQLVAWGSQIGPFNVVHDDSAIIARYRHLFELAPDPERPRFEYGYDTRTITLPLQINAFRLARSHEVLAVQVADLVAGATAHALRGSRSFAADSFTRALLRTSALRHFITVCGPAPRWNRITSA
jgi:hypothetical protein